MIPSISLVMARKGETGGFAFSAPGRGAIDLLFRSRGVPGMSGIVLVRVSSSLCPHLTRGARTVADQAVVHAMNLHASPADHLLVGLTNRPSPRRAVATR